MKKIKGKRKLGILTLGIAISISLFWGVHQSIILDFIAGILYGIGFMLTLGRDIKKQLGHLNSD